MKTTNPLSRLGAAWLEWVRQLYTGYMASVMATGIVSTALFLYRVNPLSLWLLVVACVLLIFFFLIYLLRAVLYPAEVKNDLRDPTRVFGYFTAVAGVGVVATRLSLGGLAVIPAILTLIATAIWFCLIYWSFSTLLFINEQPIEKAINGSWLIAIVGTESLAITWVLLIPLEPQASAPFQLISYMFWAFGILLYLIFIAFIMYRFFFTRVLPTDLTPPYWINMGAMAITTVAGARLVEQAHPDAFLVPLLPFVQGFTIMMWAWGTWWIPLLLIIGVWKYGISRQPLTYAPPLWSIVFPLGMYSTAIQLLSRIAGLGFLSSIVAPTVWIAFGAWVLTALGWLASIVIASGKALRAGKA
jgi:tellurite resistance protein TehA-like permease